MKKKTFIVQLLNSKKPSRTSFTQVEDALFYSNDTDASLVFLPHEDTFDFQSAKVVMFNRGDESLVERDMEVTTEDGRKVASYELPDEIISHWGQWIAQPVFINDDEIYSGAIVPFSVDRHLMHERPPKLTEVVTVTKFVQQSQELVNAMIQAEAQRITEEQVRQSSEENRVQAENERSDKYESYAQQFNDVITELSEEKDYHSLPEIAGARGGFDTLGERLSDTTTQLAQTEEQLKNISFNRYGDIELPEDFSNDIDFNMYRDSDGKVKHDFNIDAHLKTWNATHLYVDGLNGRTGANGEESSDPTNSLKTALDTAHSGSGTHYIINILSKVTDKDRSLLLGDYSITKNIAIVSEDVAYIGNIEPTDRVWEAVNGIYKRGRSQVRSVYDNQFKTFGGLPQQYKQVNSVDECRSIYGSYYTDGTDIYVNRLDGSEPTDNAIMLSLGTNAIQSYSFELGNDVEFVMKNISSIQRYDNSPNIRVYATGASKGRLILDNVNMIEAGGNGLSTDNIKSVLSFNCIGVDVKRDGFNYHNTLNDGNFIFEYDCVAFNCGINDTNGNNNATTAHEGMNVLRINSKGWNTRGPVLADVQGCYSICIDCVMHDSVRDAHPTEKTAYQFAGGDGPAKAYVINSEGGGKDTQFITSTGSFGKIYLQNVRGDISKIRNADVEFIEE